MRAYPLKKLQVQTDTQINHPTALSLLGGAAIPSRLSPLLTALVLCLAVGCTRIPQPQGFPYSDQRTMQSAHHWNVLANDVANRINTELLRQHYFNSPVHVRHSCGKPNTCGPGATFPFDEGFNDLLTTQLVRFGVNTQVSPDSTALTVDYKVQVVYHPDPPSQWPQPGVLTALTTGIMVLRDAPSEIIAIAAAAAVDTLRATSVVNGHYEVIITTSIIDRNRYVLRTSDIYYINDADFWHYQQGGAASEIPLTGGDSAPPLLDTGALKP